MENTVKNSGKTPSPARPFESFQVGETHQSPDRILTQEGIAAFAELTGDKNPIHLDSSFARGTVFRSTVAHGLFLTSILAGMAYERGLLGKNILALENSKEDYLQPVKPGDTIFGTVAIVGTNPDASKRCGRVSWELTLLKRDPQGDGVPVLEAHWETLVFKKAYLKD
ncbi:MAG: MaoC family dehydratase [Planctomycetota bacterium]|nr:MaoC family dehydratase [Planctomycetota bacterium]